jgi:two-component system response regulator VicR
VEAGNVDAGQIRALAGQVWLIGKFWGGGGSGSVHKARRKVVVYVEDEPDLVELLDLILKNKEIVLEHASTGRQGLKLIRQLKPDLVILDLMLPDIDGWDVFQEMQRDQALKHIPVVVITVRTEGLIQGEWPQVQQLAGYLLKPFAINALREVVGRALGIALV